MASLEELEQQATPGPWRHYTADRWNGGDICRTDAPYVCATTSGPDGDITKADAAFIVAFRNAAPELLKVVAAARDICDATMDDGWTPLRDALAALDAIQGADR